MFIKTPKFIKENRKNQLISTLELMIEASGKATLPFKMTTWYCSSACCAVGDVVLYTSASKDKGKINILCEKFADKLCDQINIVFGDSYIARSIYVGFASTRKDCAFISKLFTDEELKHPHLTTNHSDREILIDYINLVISKIKEK